MSNFLNLLNSFAVKQVDNKGETSTTFLIYYFYMLVLDKNLTGHDWWHVQYNTFIPPCMSSTSESISVSQATSHNTKLLWLTQCLNLPSALSPSPTSPTCKWSPPLLVDVTCVPVQEWTFILCFDLEVGALDQQRRTSLSSGWVCMPRRWTVLDSKLCLV